MLLVLAPGASSCLRAHKFAAMVSFARKRIDEAAKEEISHPFLAAT